MCRFLSVSVTVEYIYYEKTNQMENRVSLPQLALGMKIYFERLQNCS